jgi:hypothetical protein
MNIDEEEVMSVIRGRLGVTVSVTCSGTEVGVTVKLVDRGWAQEVFQIDRDSDRDNISICESDLR